VREAKEEAGVDVDRRRAPAPLELDDPRRIPERFATWFFVGPVAGGDEVRRRCGDREAAVVRTR